jgi:hypothetical protein
MQSNDIILAGVLGLDISKAEHALFIAESTKNIINIDDFIRYCRNNKTGIEYATKTERLDILTTRYLQQQEDTILNAKYKQGEEYAKVLAAKVKSCRNFVEDNYIEFSQLGADGKKYFKDHELRMLERLGSKEVVLEYSKINKLSQQIYDEYIKAIQIQHKQKSLPNQSRDVMQLVRSALPTQN